MAELDTVIKGNIVLENEVLAGEIGIAGGSIEIIAPEGSGLKAAKVLDFGKSYVFPGFIDEHVHCFSNPDEGFEPTSLAAAVGGVTTFLDMPYDRPHPINNVEVFREKVSRLQKSSVVDICLWATIAKYEGTGQIPLLAREGAIAFKMSTYETDAFRFPRIPDPEIIKALELIKDAGLVAGFHAENDEIIVDLIGEYQKENKVYARAHMETRPPVSETTAVLKLLEMAFWTKAKLHIVHVSHPRTVELINDYRAQDVQVTCETCYPYLLMDVKDLEKFGPKAKMNPPLRLPEDVQGMWNFLQNGSINFVSSDHSPWGLEDKDIGNDNIFKAASGLPGVEIIVPLMFDATVGKGLLGPLEFAKIMSTNPAAIFGIPNKGKITVGYDADFTVIDPDDYTLIDKDKLHSKVKLTPFHGKKCKGRITQTIVRGTTVFDGNEVTVPFGFGRFVPGSAKE